MAFLGLLLGEVLDALQADETVAHVTHAHRSETARDMDNSEWAERQTADIHEWLADPDHTDFLTEDNPAFSGGTYDPLGEWEE